MGKSLRVGWVKDTLYQREIVYSNHSCTKSLIPNPFPFLFLIIIIIPNPFPFLFLIIIIIPNPFLFLFQTNNPLFYKLHTSPQVSLLELEQRAVPIRRRCQCELPIRAPTPHGPSSPPPREVADLRVVNVPHVEQRLQRVRAVQKHFLRRRHRKHVRNPTNRGNPQLLLHAKHVHHAPIR